jgi:hydrogenase-4 component B
VVIGLGAVSAVLGIAFALVQNDLKRLLAYCSVENVGIILVGLGAAMLAATHGDGPWGRLALAGALLHVWNHGLAKSLLFFGAGSVLHATGTREITRLGGLWRAMPRTAGLFALGAVAICGLPPLNGFVGEWLVYLGLFDGATAGGRPAWGVAPAAIALATAGALALATFVKASAVVFLGAPRTKLAMDAHESGPWLWGPMLALAGLCATIGLAPFFFWPLVARAAGAWRPSAMAVEPLAPVATLGLANVVLALFFVGAAAWLWRRVHAEGPRPAPTWDCGYAAPTPRMQYTGGSFGGIAATWFSWALQIERTVHRPRGPFPVSASRVERVPESVLEWVVAPVAGLVMRASAAVRRLQHGRLQFYIVYLVAGLAGLGLLVLLEGNP